MPERGPYRQRGDRYRGLCVCGDHAWAVLIRGSVTFVSSEHAHYYLQGRKWSAARIGRNIYAVGGVTTRGEPFIRLHRQILGDAAGAYSEYWDGNGFHKRRDNLRTPTRTTDTAAIARLGEEFPINFEAVNDHRRHPPLKGEPRRRCSRTTSGFTFGHKSCKRGSYPGHQSRLSATRPCLVRRRGHGDKWSRPPPAPCPERGVPTVS
jgi:hypothetical protein